MAISQNAVIEVRSTATAGNVNGGLFVTGASGVDYSQQDAAQYALTGVTTAGADATLLHASAAADMVGNGAKIISGTNFTAGWYEIISVVVGVSITLDRTCTSGAGADGVVNIGGALSLGSSDDAVFELLDDGVTMHVKGNATYTIGGVVNMSTNAGALLPSKVFGYATTRGDNPLGSTRPIFDCAGNTFFPGNNIEFSYIQFKGTNSTVVTSGSANKFLSCKFTNTSTTANRVALSIITESVATDCEAISYRGRAFQFGTGCSLVKCYAHDSDIGIYSANSFTTGQVLGCISANNVTAALDMSAACTAAHVFMNNTLYGGTSVKTGVGFRMAAGCTDMVFVNNMVTGFVTGISHGSAGQTVGLDLYNRLYNNTTNATNWPLGRGTITTDPGLTGVSQVTGTTATTSGSVLTDASKDFTAAGVVAGRDYIYVVSGTGVTVGIYGITNVGTTTLTLDSAPGTSATADKVYQISIGHNFEPTSSPISVQFPGQYTTGYADIGAVQRKAPTLASGAS